MIKSCRFCQYCYCADTEDVSGLDCKKHSVLKITDLDKKHLFCPGFKTNIFIIVWRYFNG